MGDKGKAGQADQIRKNRLENAAVIFQLI